MLSRCISVSAETFAAEHWGRRPLLSSRGALPRDFDDLLSTAAVDELVAERGVRAPFLRMAKDGELLARDCYLGPAGFGAEMPDQVDPGKVLAQFAAGATLVLQGLHRLWPPVIDFVRGMVDDLGHPVQANAYVTPPGHRGFDAHYDVHDVFVLQVAGAKRWVVHRPVHRDPLPDQPWTQHRSAIAARAEDEPVLDAVLSPGDALYLPRGWVHSAHARGDTSIHLTIGASPVTGIDVAHAAIERLATVDGFRAALPIGIDPTDPDHLEAAVAKVLAEIASALRDDAGMIGPDVAARLVRRHAERTRPVAVRPLASFAAAEHAGESVVRWRRGLTGAVDASGDRVVLTLTDRTISFPSSCAAALTAVRGGASARADRLPGLDAADGAVLLRRLLREGVVVPVRE